MREQIPVLEHSQVPLLTLVLSRETGLLAATLQREFKQWTLSLKIPALRAGPAPHQGSTIESTLLAQVWMSQPEVVNMREWSPFLIWHTNPTAAQAQTQA